MAKPCPAMVPPECLMRESALCPQMTPGTAAKIEKQTRLRIPKTMLQIARAEVLGGDGLLPIGGMVSLMPQTCGCVLKVNHQSSVARIESFSPSPELLEGRRDGIGENLPVFEDFSRGVIAASSHHTPARMGRGAAKVESSHWGPIISVARQRSHESKTGE